MQTPIRSSSNERFQKRIGLSIVLFAACLGYFGFFILHFGPTIAADEYAFINGTYKVLSSGGTFSESGYRRPLTNILAVAPALTSSLSSFSFILAVFSSVMVVAGFNICRYLAGDVAGWLSVALLLRNPHVVLLTASGNSMILSTSLVLASVYLMVAFRDSRRAMVASGVLLLAAGLARPDVWPLLLPLLVYYRATGKEEERRWAFGAALLVIAAPALWVLQDYLIVGDPLRVVIRGAEHARYSPFLRVSFLGYPLWALSTSLVLTSWLGLGLAVVGFVVCSSRRGFRDFCLSPLVLFPLTIALSFWLFSSMGRILASRFLLLTGVVIILFAAVGIEWVVSRLLSLQKARYPVYLAAGVSGVLVILSYTGGLVTTEMTLAQEARKQREVEHAAAFLKDEGRLAEGSVMISGRRHGQLVWLLREGATPTSVSFRQWFVDQKSFEELGVAWIVYIADDFHHPAVKIAFDRYIPPVRSRALRLKDVEISRAKVISETTEILRVRRLAAT